MLKVVREPQAEEGALGQATLDELALRGARAMLHQALEAEVAAYLERHQARDARGRALVVSGADVAAVIETGPDGGTLAGALATTDAQGVATFSASRLPVRTEPIRCGSARAERP